MPWKLGPCRSNGHKIRYLSLKPDTPSSPSGPCPLRAAGYCHISNLSEERIAKLDAVYKAGSSTLRCRVIGYNLVDGLVHVSARKAVVDAQVSVSTRTCTHTHEHTHTCAHMRTHTHAGLQLLCVETCVRHAREFTCSRLYAAHRGRVCTRPAAGVPVCVESGRRCV